MRAATRASLVVTGGKTGSRVEARVGRWPGIRWWPAGDALLGGKRIDGVGLVAELQRRHAALVRAHVGPRAPEAVVEAGEDHAVVDAVGLRGSVLQWKLIAARLEHRRGGDAVFLVLGLGRRELRVQIVVDVEGLGAAGEQHARLGLEHVVARYHRQ